VQSIVNRLQRLQATAHNLSKNCRAKKAVESRMQLWILLHEDMPIMVEDVEPQVSSQTKTQASTPIELPRQDNTIVILLFMRDGVLTEFHRFPNLELQLL
jgi:hypothetical protein